MAAQLAYKQQSLNIAQESEPVVPQYLSFSSLPLFSASLSSQSYASPKLAAAWADAILCYWQTGIAKGGVDVSQPLYLLDMVPQSGELAWLLLGELQRRISAQKLDFKPCIISCHRGVSSAQNAAQHPFFKNDIDCGLYELAYWDEAGGALHLHHQQRILDCCENPLVILAVGYFQTLASELLGIYCGKTLQASAAITKVNPTQDGFEFAYQWQSDPKPLPVLAERLLAHYRHSCNGSTFMLPVQALERLDKLNTFARGRSLLLAADAGVTSTHQIRLGALCPPAKWSKQDPPPRVNFHAISQYQQSQGAQVWQQQLDDDGVVLHMAWRDDYHSISSSHFNLMAETLAGAHPDDIRRLAASQHSAADTLSLLRLSHYDPQLLKTNITRLLEQPLALTDSARRHWQAALVRTWCNYLPSTEYDSFYYQVGLLATHMGHLALAKECFRLGLSWYGDESTDLYLLAWCESVSGGVRQAVELLTRALTLEPNHEQSLTLLSTLQDRLELWQKNAWVFSQEHRREVGGSQVLRLEPLGAEHAQSLLYQYRDRQIGIMTRLPEWETLEQLQFWITDQQQDSSRACFAVMHAHWGFVGMVSCQCAASAGYFYFWIGSDFQQQGLGQQAAQLLFDCMLAKGVTHIFTSAYEDNSRSASALTRLGFSTIGVKAKEPDNTMAFFYLNLCGKPILNEQVTKAALVELCRAIDSPLQLVNER